MKLFHGTTIENAMSILNHGFNYDQKNWNCSEDKTYFFTEEYFRYDHGAETEEEVLQYGINEAMQQSLITLARENPTDYRGAVLVFETDLMNNGKEIEPDDSCPNMEGMAVALRNPDMSGLVGVYVMQDDLKAFRFFTLASFVENEYLQEVELNPSEQQLVMAIAKTDLNASVYDITSDLTWSELNINDQIHSQVA